MRIHKQCHHQCSVALILPFINILFSHYSGVLIVVTKIMNYVDGGDDGGDGDDGDGDDGGDGEDGEDDDNKDCQSL